MEYILQTSHLTKRFGKNVALLDVDLHLCKGDIYGFIGKNGAGKTTLMKIVLGLLEPTSGSVTYGTEYGADVDPKKARKRIGSLIEAPGLFLQGTAKENMKRMAILTGDNDQTIDELLSFVGLGEVKKKKVKAFSLGMKQRLGVAIALLGDPYLLVLDEPMNALDPAGIKELRELLMRVAHEKGVSILISSHIIDELAKIATVFGVIKDGRLMEEVRVEDFERSVEMATRVEVKNPYEAKEALKAAGYFVQGDSMDQKGVLLKTKGIQVSAVIDCLAKAGIEVLSVHPENGQSLEDFFIERMGD